MNPMKAGARWAVALCVLGLVSAASCASVQDPGHGIIPVPEQVTVHDYFVTLDEQSTLQVDPSFERAGEVLVAALKETGNLTLTLEGSAESARIAIVKNEAIDRDGYRIRMTPDAIEIQAANPAGAFYAAQSLRQHIWSATTNSGERSIRLRAIDVDDAPQFDWRGFHIDVSRHFFTKEYVMEVVDWMALYKKNKLHLHLTDDQGWRLQIDRYPRLTEVGAWRELNRYDSTVVERSKTNPIYALDARFLTQRDGKVIYGGFYTKDDIREIIDHAARNFIEVIPEVDMPGHMSAAIRAYPDLSCEGGEGWGVEFSHPMCPCKAGVTEFATNVWDEVIELFPSNTVHIGADEVEKGTWEESQECKLFMEEHGLETVEEIQNHFVRELQKHLESKGKTVVAWDDVIDGDVDDSLLIMYWRDYQPDSPTRTAANGNSIIMTPWSWFYLSFRHTDERFEDLYKFDPHTELEPQVLDHVIGYQSSVWTELIPSEEVFEYLIFPRFQASAEIAWAADRRNWDAFKSRLVGHLAYMDRHSVHYRQPGFLK